MYRLPDSQMLACSGFAFLREFSLLPFPTSRRYSLLDYLRGALMDLVYAFNVSTRNVFIYIEYGKTTTDV